MTCSVAWFAEHDIDIWLAEELRTNPAFGKSILAKLEIVGASVPAYKTRVSVMDDAGRETDVEALFYIPSGQTVALLVENKIKAGFQPNQMIDYLDRGRRGIKEGKWAAFLVLVFAPAYRNMAAANLPASIRTLTFEEAASWLRTGTDDDRNTYRASFLERAAKINVVSIETENPFVAQWWIAVYEMLSREFGDFFITSRKTIPRTTYVNARCAGMAPYLRLDLKGSQGQVELCFNNCTKQKLEYLTQKIKPENVRVVEYPKAAALQISGMDKYLISDGLEVIDTRVRTSYQAGKDLLLFWQSNRQLFDDAMAIG